MKKPIGIMLVILSLIALFIYLETSAFIIAPVSAAIGITGIIFLCRSGKTEFESAVLSVAMIVLGGLIIPLLPLLEKFSTSLTIIAYAAAIILLVLKPPERLYTRAPVEH